MVSVVAVVVVPIAPGLQFALFFTVYTWPLETHARTHTHTAHTHTLFTMCWFLFECVAADPAHTYTRTHTGRPFLSSCRCGRVPNDIFYTLFLGSPSFRSISQRRVANPKANETKRVLCISTQLNSPQLSSLNSTQVSIASASVTASVLPLPASLPCQLVPFGSSCCCCCCWAQFSVFVWQVHQIIDRWLCTGSPVPPLFLSPAPHSLHN